MMEPGRRLEAHSSPNAGHGGHGATPEAPLFGDAGRRGISGGKVAGEPESTSGPWTGNPGCEGAGSCEARPQGPSGVDLVRKPWHRAHEVFRRLPVTHRRGCHGAQPS
jgi:hypothetical protein